MAYVWHKACLPAALAIQLGLHRFNSQLLEYIQQVL